MHFSLFLTKRTSAINRKMQPFLGEVALASRGKGKSVSMRLLLLKVQPTKRGPRSSLWRVILIKRNEQLMINGIWHEKVFQGDPFAEGFVSLSANRPNHSSADMKSVRALSWGWDIPGLQHMATQTNEPTQKRSQGMHKLTSDPVVYQKRLDLKDNQRAEIKSLDLFLNASILACEHLYQ